ncbi:SDR family NAD(P)-dependent oxidoreductase [Sphingopyxis sp.]|uniref:SDR family NAD(P)-dependent oxidoreductase n=1 Tax=Sphingopyxis sp. TaxID=1908224 RepID=UPI0025FC5C20|nr:SDR family NAD(P)-dependent oxidoreductase [Sphingopyxis sp.]
MTDMRLNDHGAVVTGGASGIGAAIVRRFVAEGAKVVIVDVNEDLGAALLGEIGEEYGCYIRCDVGKADQVEAMVDAADRWLSAAGTGLDILVNNAAIGGNGQTPDMSIETWLRVIEVDLHAVFFACRRAIPLMRKQGGGAIVNTASISGIRGDRGFSPYSAAKAAVINYTRTLALDHGVDNIRVNALCPGLVDTPILAGALDALPAFTRDYMRSLPLGRAGRPEEIANAALFLASDEASYVTGTTLVVDGGRLAGTGQPNIEDWLASKAEQAG